MYVTSSKRGELSGLGFDLTSIIGAGAAIVTGGAARRRATRLAKDINEARARMAGGDNGPDADYLRAVAAANGDLTRYEYDIKRKAAGDVNLYPLAQATTTAPMVTPSGQVIQAATSPVGIAAIVGVGVLAFVLMGRRRRRR